MTPGADVSLMYLPSWEALGTIYAWYSLSASSSPAQLQVPDALSVKVGRNTASPRESTFLLLYRAVMVPAVTTVMSSLQIYAGQFVQFSLSRGEKGIIHKYSMQGARREVEAYVLIWQRTDWAPLLPTLLWLQSIYTLLLQSLSQKSLLLVLPAHISKRIISCMLNRSNSPQKRPSLCLLE